MIDGSKQGILILGKKANSVERVTRHAEAVIYTEICLVLTYVRVWLEKGKDTHARTHTRTALHPWTGKDFHSSTVWQACPVHHGVRHHLFTPQALIDNLLSTVFCT